MLRWLMLVTGPLQENCHILWRDGSADAILFDPGDEGPRIQAALNERGLAPAAIVLTHTHGDHIGAVEWLKAKHPTASFYCPAAEVSWLSNSRKNLSFFFGANITAPPPDHVVNDDDVLKLAGLELKAILVPGHSPGSTAYYVESPGEAPHLFGGDILFRGGIGRTDFPGSGGEEMLVEGIRERLFVLPGNTIVHPGHGPDTDIETERESNPFCSVA